MACAGDAFARVDAGCTRQGGLNVMELRPKVLALVLGVVDDVEVATDDLLRHHVTQLALGIRALAL